MTTVRRWTGHEAGAPLSVRAFAERLGVVARTVSTWEAEAGSVVTRPDTQAILDTALGRADGPAQQRFELLCVPAAPHASSNADVPRVSRLSADVGAFTVGSTF